jgi:hypothetical protein
VFQAQATPKFSRIRVEGVDPGSLEILNAANS